MLSVKAASLFALIAGSAAAVPQHAHQHLHKRDYQRPAPPSGGDTATVVDDYVVTVVTYETKYVDANQPAATAPAYVAAPAPAQATSAPVYYQPAPAPTYQAPSPAPAPSNGGGADYMGCVNKYRSLMGVQQLQWSSDLQNGIQKTVNDGNGQMVHAFNDDATGQVLAPGSADGFETAFVQGWICEANWLPFLQGVCVPGTYIHTDDGHYQILSRSDITECGCAFSEGIWGCDVK